MSTQPIWIVDAFTDKAYHGNPAAVMIVPEFPKDAQEIASEMNLSETAFVKHLKGNRFHIRWLTPAVEVKLCGHATLASAHILFNEKVVVGDEIIFESLSGELRVTRDGDSIILDFPLQRTGAQLEMGEFSEALGIQPGQIIEVVQAYDDVIVAVSNEKIVKELEPDFAKLGLVQARGIIVTARGSDVDFVSRFFGPQVGVNEDPVTGSAHCKLADYWSRKLNKSDLSAFQASSRGGKLGVTVRGERVLLKGRAVTVLKGEWLISL